MKATVIDGDTIEIHSTRIRLYGIDALESGQTCEEQRKVYRCGQQAALVLSDHRQLHIKGRSRPLWAHDCGLLYRR